MEKLLQVKEFDIITDKNYTDPKDRDRYRYMEPKVFQELMNYIRENAKRRNTKRQKKEEVFDVMKFEYHDKLGCVVKVQNYVGVIRLKSGYQIEILPKVMLSTGEDAGKEQTKKIFLKMLRSLKRIRGKTFSSADLNVDRMNLYEIIINMYLREVRCLVKRGIKSDYITQEENLRYYKGKLLVSRHIKENFCHKERFYVSYDEFHPDRAENRLIKATLLMLQKVTGSAKNAKELRQLLFAFEKVTPSVNYVKDFAKVVKSRNTKEYETLMYWSKLFLNHFSFTTSVGMDSAHSLLFPMEEVYEKYVAQYVKKVFMPDGWNVTVQDESFFLFDISQMFLLKPDIVCEKEGRTVIMDTKWKRLNNIKKLHYGIDQADLYQMYAYASKYHASEVWLLYPCNGVKIPREELEFRAQNDVSVSVHFIDVANIEENLKQLKERIEL